MIASLNMVPGELDIHSITDLGWPISLLNLGLGVVAARRSDAPIYVSGYDPGYEEIAFPGFTIRRPQVTFHRCSTPSRRLPRCRRTLL
jgi:hypothetical protein